MVAVLTKHTLTCDHGRRFSPHLKGRSRMTLEQRVQRTERMLIMMARSGLRARDEFREKINILIDSQIKYEEIWRAKSDEVNEQIKALAIAQAELAQSQKLTDRALRDYLNSQRRRENGNSSS